MDTVLNIDVAQEVDTSPEPMTLYKFARWTALIRGVGVIESKARQLKIDLDKDKNWVKPLALQKYVDEQTPSTIAEIKCLMDNEE